MPRSRVLSFMSQWGVGGPPRSPTNEKPEAPPARHTPPKKLTVDTATPANAAQIRSPTFKDSPSPTTQQRFRSDSRSESRNSRPMSMIQTYQPPTMDVAQDTLPELQPIFTFLNSHSNKLYQEGYFLKLHDLDSRGRPSTDRVWNECFAQLVGTVLSLWDAAALDAAGEDGEVVPTFVNLSDASIKMIESLPMNGSAGGSLQNVLSISTAANNRYLLHFNSLNSLTQWTAGIRLSIYEHATLHEAYTGSLIAGKGKMLNNIRTIMERSRFKHEDWARVRFGAGTPWRRCWCVITPPDEKEYQKAQKSLKKRDTYDRTVKIPKGDVRFYDTRKVTKKTRPIATITDAYAAYAIYPQSKPLIDQSTLVKIEGLITINASPQTTTEGFVFVMPEVHPAVTGFEMMLRFLFPIFDTFALYGRPTRLIADTLDQRGLMFAMPQDRRYGYLDILDVSGLIHTEGSQNWSERQWRKELKKLTSHRMSSGEIRGTPRRNTLTSRTSLNLNRGAVKFGDESPPHSTPTTRRGSPAPINDDLQFAPPRRTETTPVKMGSPARGHNRSASEALSYKRYQTETPSRLSYEAGHDVEAYDEYPPEPPIHGTTFGERKGLNTLERVISETEEPYDDHNLNPAFEELNLQSAAVIPAPVASPPDFSHSPGSKPARTPHPAAEQLRRANSAMDADTLHQLADATGRLPPYERDPENYRNDLREVASVANRAPRMSADASTRHEGMVEPYAGLASHKSRLSTIPGSPYNNANYSNPNTPPPVPIHKNLPVYGGSPSISKHLGSSHSISRKPVPVTTAAAMQSLEGPPSPPSPPSPSSTGSLRGELIENAVLERMLQQSPVSVAYSRGGDRGHNYHHNDYHHDDKDDDDNDSVDYASTAAPSPPKRRLERQRTGRLKTVGNPDLVQEAVDYSRLDPASGKVQEQQIESFPVIDFGPTIAYKPDGRPRTSDSADSRSPKPEVEAPLQEVNRRSSSRLSLLETQRNSYFEGRRGQTGNGYQEKRRSVAWQPAAASPVDASSPGGLTPEQWVQYRASMASQSTTQLRPTPVYSHARQLSSNNLARSTSKTPPPLSRTPSGDWSRQMGRMSKTPPLSRTQSGDWTGQGAIQVPSRPQSRGAGAYLNPPSPGKLLQNAQSSYLSAREQTYVARATGTPLLGLSSKDKKQQTEEAQAPGLIGAMAARERERAAIKEGMRSGVVQQAIQARQQQQAQAEMEARMQSQLQAQQHAQAQAYQLQQQQQQQVYQQVLQQQQQMYQNTMGGQAQTTAGSMYGGQAMSQYMGGQPRTAASSMYGSRPTSQYLGQLPMTPGGPQSPGESWDYAGHPQQQVYSAPYQQQQQQLHQQQQHQQQQYQQQQRRYG